jgi:hypothetical protein
MWGIFHFLFNFIGRIAEGSLYKGYSVVAISSEWWFCLECWSEKLWWMAFHNSRTFTWIFTNFTHSFLWDYHSWVRPLSHVLYKMVSKNARNMQRVALAFISLEQFHKDVSEFLSHVVWIMETQYLDFCCDFVKISSSMYILKKKKKEHSVVFLARERTVLTFVDRECRVVGTMNPHDRILRFLDRNIFFSPDFLFC